MSAYTKKELVEMWKRPVERQYNIAMTKIFKAIQDTEGEIAFCFSGGKDSSLLLDMYCEVLKDTPYKDKPINVYFADTTNETSNMRKFIAEFIPWIEAKHGVTIDFHEIRPKDGIVWARFVLDNGIPLISKAQSKAIRVAKRDMLRTGCDYDTVRRLAKPDLKCVRELFDIGFTKTGVLALTGYISYKGEFGKHFTISKKWLPMRGWLYYGGSPKEDIEDNLDILRQRSRDAYMGIPTASAALKTLRTNVVAGGLMPSPQIDAEFLRLTNEEAEALQAQILREFSLWADTKVCDADRVDNFYKLQQLAFLSYLMNGDAIALLQMKEQSGQPYSLRVRLIEADRVCSPDGYDRLTPCEVRGRRVYSIVQGVETDEDGMVIAYWICNRHPLSSISNQAGVLEWTRVEAYGSTGRPNVLHVMNRERAGQRRGVPILAPVLEALKQLGRYTEAEITAAVISAMFTVFVKSATVQDGKPIGEMLPPDMLIDAQDQGSIELGNGAVVALNPGEDVEFADPKHPNSGYDAFFSAMIKEIGAALEIPPEVLEKQFTQNFSSARGSLNEFWRTCGMMRDWFSDDFTQPIYEAWFAEAVARGRIQAPGFFSDPVIRKAYTDCKWNGPARTAMNPSQEVEAAIKRVDAGFSTAEEETAQLTGGDYKVYREACEITAYICKLYGIDPHGTVTVNGVKVPTILCHQDSYRLGLGSNHGDVLHWFPKFGKSMEDARNDVAALLAAPKTEGYTAIAGNAQATAGQMRDYIKAKNPAVPQSVLDMVPLYLTEGAAEGIRGDIAFAQSCLETGNFAFAGSAVTLDQNNFCGMGVTSNGVKGNSFATAQLGIRAQIQHLKAYASTAALNGECVDPRFSYVTRGCAEYVEWLGQQENPDGKGWATGAGYGGKILSILKAILAIAETETEEEEVKRYNKISEMPGYAQPTIIKMVDAGLIGGTGTGAKDESNRPADLDLSMDMIRVFVTNDRAGLYDKK